MDKAPDKAHLVSRLSDTLAANKGQAEALIAFALLFPQPDAAIQKTNPVQGFVRVAK